MKYEVVYGLLLKECKKQLIKGEVVGVTASVVAEKLSMKRPNVVREFKKLLEYKMINKKPGRPTYYYIDLEDIAYDIKNEDAYEIIYNLDKYFNNRSRQLWQKGYNESEIKKQFLNEVNNYINKYFKTIRGEVSQFNIKKSDVKYIIGVEGGGIKTEAIAYDLKGNEVSRGNADFGSLLINFDDALKNAEMAIIQCVRKLKEENCLYIYIGLSGSEIGRNFDKIKTFFQERFKAPIKIVDDKDITISSMLQGEDGIAIYSRVGSICYASNKGKKIRIGGWGHLLGDEGSGYKIVTEAFKEMMMDKDNGKGRSELTRKLLKAISANDEHEALDFIYSKNKGEIYDLLNIIAKESDNDNKRAVKLLQEAGYHLADLVIKSYKRLKFQGVVNIAIKGSVIIEIYHVRKSFINKLKSEGIEFKIHVSDSPLAKGAYYKVLKELSLG